MLEVGRKVGGILKDLQPLFLKNFKEKVVGGVFSGTEKAKRKSILADYLPRNSLGEKYWGIRDLVDLS